MGEEQFGFNARVEESLNQILSKLGKLESRINVLEGTDSIKSANYTKKLREEKIQYCLNEFDFRRVHDIMKYLNWEWVLDQDGHEYGVPSIDDLKIGAESLLRQCYDEMDECEETNLIIEIDDKYKCFKISSGGFSATTWKDNNCRLSFELEYSESFE